MKTELVIHDLKTAGEEVLLACPEHIEAPNWDPSGFLIVNGEGRLFEVPLGAPELRPVDTGALCGLNNDHGLSPDGAWLAISDKTETGQSCIYVLPRAGGAPRRVTSGVPSYWHGWSPDGARLAYTAKRGGAFDIFTIPTEGGTETRLTQNMGHTDGPDYTPDGRWIWFNADRTGSAQLWRMHPDGSNLQQMTDDARVNWFPHPAPNGGSVLFLSYPEGTTGHPGGLDVELRLMPAEGGTPQVITSLFGGQGTINVPSWSPDGQKFAYCRYERPIS